MEFCIQGLLKTLPRKVFDSKMEKGAGKDIKAFVHELF